MQRNLPEQSQSFAPTHRSKMRRLPKQGSYDRDLIYRILDEGLICHVGFVVEGQPYVIPTVYAREEDQIYIHGSPISQMMQTVGKWCRGLYHSHLAGRIGSCPVCISSLDELSLSRNLRNSYICS